MKNELAEKIDLSYVMLIFLFVFAPPLVPRINLMLVLFIYVSFKMFANYKNNLKAIFIESNAFNYMKFMIFSWMYITVIMFIGYLLDPVDIQNYIKTWYRLFMIFPAMISCIVYIIIKTQELGYGFKEVIKALIYAGLIQAAITILMLVIPNFRELILRIIFFNTNDELSQNLWQLERRYFAFSHNVLDTFGYGTGILAALPLYYGALTGKYKYFLYSLILLIVPLFNSRTGLVIFFIGLVLFIPGILIKIETKKILQLIIILSIGIIIFITVQDYLAESFPSTMMWVESGIEDLLGFFGGESGNDSVSIITDSDRWQLPNSIWFISGTGHNVYGASGYPHSDVGYVNDIWLVGFFGFILLYFPLILLTVKSFFSTKEWIIRLLIIFLTIALFVTNFKTIVLNYNVGTSIVFLVTFYLSWELDQTKLLKLKKGLSV